MRLANSFIAVDGVGERTERDLWRAGITHWDAFDGATVPGVGPTLADRIGAFVDEARDRLAAGDARYFASTLPDREAWRLFEDFRDRTAYLDIETTGLSQHRDDVTVVSVHGAGGTTSLVRGRDLSAGALEAALDDAELLVTFNGARFDVPFLEASFDVALDHAHVDLMYPCRRLGLTGGLKAVERTIGVERDRPDISGLDAVRLWRRYARRGDEDALETLVEYNREDTVNLETLMETVADRLHREVFEAALGADDAAPQR
ncbi:MAG: ribonuclease H-like domain-containing protein [Halobacteriales archaeon]|nr:ribonuclease H-like domain-containing protein [Halobacteriales archaeon]